MPYLLFSAPLAALVMVLLPNAGSFGFGYASTAALLFGAIAILFMIYQVMFACNHSA